MECTDGDSFVLTRHLLVVRGNRHPTPYAAELGSNLRTVLSTQSKKGSQEQFGPHFGPQKMSIKRKGAQLSLNPLAVTDAP